MTDTSGHSLLEHVLVPLASEDDARRTATALAAYAPERVTIIFVVEKAGGGPDTLSPEQASTFANTAFDAFQAEYPHADRRIASGTNITQTIFSVADEIDATSIAFVSRSGGRIMKLLTGDIALKLVTENDIPVIALPAASD